MATPDVLQWRSRLDLENIPSKVSKAIGALAPALTSGDPTKMAVAQVQLRESGSYTTANSRKVSDPEHKERSSTVQPLSRLDGKLLGFLCNSRWEAFGRRWRSE